LRDGRMGMRIFFMRAVRPMSLAAILAAAVAADAVAQGPLSLFPNAAQAQQHCPNDSVVWLDFKKRIYYLQGQRQYARGRTATYVCREEARRNGYRRSLVGRR
jgi:hypothetical protein